MDYEEQLQLRLLELQKDYHRQRMDAEGPTRNV
jgi:hypothetical protein